LLYDELASQRSVVVTCNEWIPECTRFVVTSTFANLKFPSDVPQFWLPFSKPKVPGDGITVRLGVAVGLGMGVAVGLRVGFTVDPCVGVTVDPCVGVTVDPCVGVFDGVEAMTLTTECV
jgi:hypothetical protein